VQDITLETDQVRVRARVDGYAFVGDQSQADVRMLTVVGGYYVNLVSLGDTALGTNAIPANRVKMPYNLMQTLSDSRKITNEVSPIPINESLNQLQNGLKGRNVESLSAVIDAGNSFMSTLERQRGQITAVLNYADEYTRALNNFSDGLRILVRKASIIEQMLTLYAKKFGDGLATFGRVLDALSPLDYFYDHHREKFLTTARDWLEKARMWSEHSGVVVRAVRAMRNKIERVLDAQNATPELLATDMCLPVPGSAC
jgi:ABC-type transporter Mla subunit MlaD